MIFAEYLSGSYEARAISAAASRTINLFPERVESGDGKSGWVLLGTPGYSRFVDLSAYGDWPHGLFVVKSTIDEFDKAFGVVGGHLVEFFADGTQTDHGSVGGGSFGSMASDGTLLLIAANGVDIYYHALVGLGVGGPIANVSGTFLESMDGYFIAVTGQQTFAISAQYDGLTWDPLDFASAEAYPDPITAMKRLNRSLFLAGSESIQEFSNTGASDFPFEAIPGATFHIGAINGSLQECGGALLFVAKDSIRGFTVMRLDGGGPVRISTHPLEEKLRKLEAVVTAFSFSYAENGHDFYGFTLIRAGVLTNTQGFEDTTDTAHVYDMNTGIWHERSMWSFTNDAYLGSKISSHVFAFGKHLVGHEGMQALYEMSLDTFSDAIAADRSDADNVEGRICSERRAPYLSSEKKFVEFPGLELEMDAGEGSSIDPNPTIQLSWSNDGGRTFTPEVPRKVGASGDYRQRIRWNRLGKSRGRIFRTRTFSKFKKAITACYLDQPVIYDH
jgi:hypothetical protein